MKKKIIIITLCSIIGLIFLDFIVALLFNNSPIIKIRDYYNGGSTVYKDKGIFTNTYKCSDGKTKTVLKTTKYVCPMKDIEKDIKEAITITFDTKGGSKIDSITIGKDTELTLPKEPTRDSYVFKGWVDKNETPIYDKVLLAEDTTLYAVWEKDATSNKITITFDTKGGSKIESITISKDTELTLPKEPTRDGYVFKGWESLDLVDPNNYSKEFKSFMKKIGIKKDIPLKNLRHTNTTFFVARGENIKAVQNRVGHENIETTLTYYAQANSDEDRKLVNTYEQVFYNKLGLSMSEIYKLVSNRITDTKKIITVLEKIGNEYIDDTNYDLQLERCQEYLKELFPLVDKVLQIDSLLSEKEIDALFDGVTYLYKNIKIETLDPELKI